MLNKYVMFLEEITKRIDKGSPVDIIYLDFQKAFDKVPHQRLLLKLKAHGIWDGLIDWIEQWLIDIIQRVADYTNVFGKVNTDGDIQDLHNDLDRLVKWSEKFGKCKCLHTTNYKMGDTVLGTTVKENDLGVTISADLKVSEQCGIAASKGNQILGLIRRNITYKDKKLIIPLYKAIVRPHLIIIIIKGLL